MVQELHVLKCFSCETFQSQIVKKTNKWECKICGAKQSVKKVYGRGSGKDCRLHTQKLNALKGEKDHKLQSDEDPSERQSLQECLYKNNCTSLIVDSLDAPKSSKWAAYIDCNESLSSKNLLAQEEISPNYCLGKIQKDSGSGTKRKREKYETDLEDENVFNADTCDLLEDNYPALNYTSATSKKGIKFVNRIKRNHIELEDHTSLETFEIEDKKNKTSKFTFKNKTKNDVENKISFKWAKYLEEEPRSEEEICPQNPTQSQTMMSSLGREKLKSETEQCHSLGQNYGIPISNIDEVENCPVNKCKSDVNYQHLISHTESLHNPENCSKMPVESLLTASLRSDGMEQMVLGVEDKLTYVQAHSSLPVFEQNCDLSDSDFQIDF